MTKWKDNSNLIKSEFLGMPVGRATGRLRKSIMFRMAQKLGEDICHQCGLRIETVDDFSIEHKVPWQGRSVELFWDVDNIAFSHLRCNIRAASKPTKKIAPDGYLWCTGCVDFRPTEVFNKAPATSTYSRSGKMIYCRTCRSAQQAERRARTGKR